MKIKKRIFSLALAGTMALGLMPGMTMTASATEPDPTTSYTLTIPSTLTVANSGWNATDGISATGTLESGKKLSVTASSDDEFALVNQSDNTQKVGYILATAAEDTTATTSWEFDSLSDTAVTKPMGIIVDDYSSKPAGTYQDTVTFTAKVENAAGPLAAAFEDGAKFKVGYKWNRDGRNTTYLEFTNSGGTYSLTSISGAGQDGFNSSTLTVKDGNVLALDLVCDPGGRDDRMGEFEAQIEFDATYGTYKYSSKGELFTGIISVSVNDTDITNQLSEKTNASTATTLDTATTAWTAGTFAVPAGGLTYSDAITVSGDVTLVLTDGETLTLNKGISIADGATLTVQGSGTMNVNGSNGNTSSTVAGSGTLVLTSGTLVVTGGTAANVAQYGTSSSAGGVAVNGSVVVNGGTLNATGGVGGSLSSYTVRAVAGVGGTAISGNVTVNAGTVTATGGNGGSDAAYASGARAGDGGVAIGGDATITAGTWTATDGSAGAKGPSEDGMAADGTVGAGGKAVAGTVTDNR